METLNQPNTFESLDFDAEFAAMMGEYSQTAALPQDHPEQNPLTEQEIDEFVAALDSGEGLSEYDQNFLNEAGIAAGPMMPEQQQADAMRSVFDKDDKKEKVNS
jgi:hypothetical protein